MVSAVDLQQFCARIDIREYLKKPWTRGGFAYGCNGHILVRIPTNEPDAAEGNPIADKADELLEKAGKAAYIALPAFTPPRRCLGCGGDGRRLMLQCPDCEGDGYFHRGRHEYECKECEGDGLLDADEATDGAAMHDCPECGGIGYHESSAPVGNAHYSTVYLRQLSMLPNLRICTTGYEKGAHFVFDGGEGLLMPRRAA
jgi:hypothetical protein